ncbi:AI-2E family transporter [Streptomyces xiamenensis]|uniref:AI-2E family transporter n=1 Tax=Streptomyces xiamenensis TaxID=408015 RepID=UPI0037D66908
MSGVSRFKTGLARLNSRVSAYRAAAEREIQRREREAEERVAGRAEDSGGGYEQLEARVRRTVAPDVPGPVEGPPAGDGGGAAGSGAGGAGAGAGGDGGGAGPGDAQPPATPERPAPDAVIPWGVRVAAEAGWRVLVLAAVVWVLIQVVSAVSLLVIAFAAGLLVTALLQPFVGRLKRLGVGRGLATAIVSIGGFLVMGGVGWFVVWQVIENTDRLVEQVQDGIDQLRDWVLQLPFGVTEENINETVDNLNSWITDHSDELTSAGLEGINYLTQFLSGAGVALFVTLFLLYDGRGVWYWFLKLVPAQAREGVAGAGPRAWITLTGYVRGTVLVALIDALGIGIGLFVLEVPMAVPLAVIVFLSAFVPLVGAIASGALAVVVALVTNGLFTALMVLCVVLLVQQVEGHILQPFILGRLVKVHPLAVVLAVTAGTLLAGIPGAVVAVPLVAVANTVVGYLRAYQAEADLRNGPSGATIAPLAPVRPAPPVSPPEDGAGGAGREGDRPRD